MPEITRDPGLRYPTSKLTLLCEFLAAYLGIFLIVAGLQLAVAPQLREDSRQDCLSLMAAPLTITWMWNENYFYLLIIMFFSLMENTAQTFSQAPQSDVESWARKCIDLYERLGQNMNLPLLLFMSLRYLSVSLIPNEQHSLLYSQVLWILMSFFAFTLPLGGSHLGFEKLLHQSTTVSI